MTRSLLKGVGALLALMMLSVAAPAFAQHDPTASLNTQTTHEDPAARNRRIADQHGLPPNVLTSREDEYGRPIPRRIEDAIADLGPEGARLAALDDYTRCSALTELRSIKQQIATVEAEVQNAAQAVLAARTEADRRIAIARQERAQNDLWQLLLAGIRLGLVTQIPGVGWAYGGVMLGNEASNWLNRRQHDFEMQAHDAVVDWTMAMGAETVLRLRAHDLRNDAYDLRGQLWDESMGRYCEAHMPYYERMRTE